MPTQNLTESSRQSHEIIKRWLIPGLFLAFGLTFITIGEIFSFRGAGVLAHFGEVMAVAGTFHAVYVAIIANHEQTLRKAELEQLFKTYLDQSDSKRMILLTSQSDLYKVALDTIEQVEKTNIGRKTIQLVSIHGPDLKKIGIRKNSLAQPFVAKLKFCVNSTDWNFQEMTGVNVLERLDDKINQIKAYGAAKNYKVKAVINAIGPSILCPLIIGDEDVFLGIDDPAYYTCDRAIHIHGKEYVAFVRSYFESLWDVPGSFELRNENGFRPKVEKQLRNKLSRVSRK